MIILIIVIILVTIIMKINFLEFDIAWLVGPLDRIAFSIQPNRSRVRFRSSRDQVWKTSGQVWNHKVIYKPVYSKTVIKFAFRRYNHSKFAVSHFHQNGLTIFFPLPPTSASHKIFWPIKCSQESEAPVPYTIKRRWKLQVRSSHVHSVSISWTVNGTVVVLNVGDREWFRQC